MAAPGSLLTAGAALLVLAAGLAWAQQADNSSSPTVAPSAAPAAVPLVALYEIEGTAASVNVTMATATGVKQFASDVPMHAKDVPAIAGLQATVRPGQALYLSAQQDLGGTTVTCRITVDGTIIAENTSNGRFRIVTCQGVAP